MVWHYVLYQHAGILRQFHWPQAQLTVQMTSNPSPHNHPNRIGTPSPKSWYFLSKWDEREKLRWDVKQSGEGSDHRLEEADDKRGQAAASLKKCCLSTSFLISIELYGVGWTHTRCVHACHSPRIGVWPGYNTPIRISFGWKDHPCAFVAGRPSFSNRMSSDIIQTRWEAAVPCTQLVIARAYKSVGNWAWAINNVHVPLTVALLTNRGCLNDAKIQIWLRNSQLLGLIG